MKKSLYCFCLLSLLNACELSKNPQLIIGKWQGAEWLVNGRPSANEATATQFTFTDKGEYSYTNSGSIEKGTYKIDHDQLFTTPANETEIMVKILKLTSDSLVFYMNRSGQAETLTLLKVK